MTLEFFSKCHLFLFCYDDSFLSGEKLSSKKVTVEPGSNCHSFYVNQLFYYLVVEVYEVICSRTGKGYAVSVDNRAFSLEFRIKLFLYLAFNYDPVSVLKG